MNGDNYPDIIEMPVGWNNNISVRLNDQSGHFTDFTSASFTTYSGYGEQYDVGKIDTRLGLDIFGITYSSSNNYLALASGNNNGYFVPFANGPITTSAIAIHLADLDKDSDDDLIAVSDDYPGTLVRIQLNSSGTFGAEKTFYTAQEAESVISADMNGDGFLDLVIRQVDRMSIHLQTATPGVFVLGAEIMGEIYRDMFVSDVDQDGDMDILSLYDKKLYFSLNNGVGTSFVTSLFQTYSSTPDFALMADLNRDSIDDLIYTTNVSGVGYTIGIRFGLGQGEFSMSHHIPTPDYARSFNVADLNNDSNLVILMKISSSNFINFLAKP